MRNSSLVKVSLSLIALCTLAVPAFSDTPSAAAPRFHFEGMLLQLPGDMTVGLVEVDDTSDKKKPIATVVEIPADLPGWDKLKRAQTVAERLNAAYAANPTFWKSLVDTMKNDEVVIKFMNDDKWLITADRASARMQKLNDTHEYAQEILMSMRKALEGYGVRDAKFDYQLVDPKEKRERANLYRGLADRAYAAHDLKRAEQLYLRALKVLPDYDECHLRLGALYVEQKKYDAARTHLNMLKDADIADKQEADELLAKIK